MAGKGENRPMSVEELKNYRKVAGMLALGSIVFMAVLGLLIHVEVLKFHPNTVSINSLQTISARVEYALRYQSLLVGWLLFSVLYVIYGRVTFKAVNPTVEETEQNIVMHKSVLTNSLESIVINILAQLTFVVVADAHCVLRYIPYINIVMLIGRITFWYGYPNKRSFGMMCTLATNILLVTYNFYKLAVFVFGGH